MTKAKLDLVWIEHWIDDPIYLQAHLATLSWQQESIRLFGRPIKVPRQVLWMADDGIQYRYSGIDHHPVAWTAPIAALRARLEDTFAVKLNSVLGNYYRNGHDSMGWHSDNEIALGPQPAIASVSLGAERRFCFRHRTTSERFEIRLPSGSLCWMMGDCQRDWQHALPKMRALQDPRYNLTFRFVHIKPSKRQ